MKPSNFKIRIWDKLHKRFCPIHVDAYRITWHGDFWSIACSQLYDETCFPFCNLEAKRFVIQQYTGVKDSKGTEVYEGDIIHDRVSSNILDKEMGMFLVRFNTTYAAFVLEKIDEKRAWHWIRNVGSHGRVVGNIFENPKLLK